jgi:hypothetical protein
LVTGLNQEKQSHLLDWLKKEMKPEITLNLFRFKNGFDSIFSNQEKPKHRNKKSSPRAAFKNR